MNIKSISEHNRIKINDIIRDEWNGPVIVSRGKAINSSDLPGYVYDDGNLLGFVLYCIGGGECEVTVLMSLEENRGVGTALLNAVIEKARQSECKRVWLITTNDNTHAIRFYQKHGFALKTVHIGALNETRKIKPLPERGIDGIPLLHEFEFEIIL